MDSEGTDEENDNNTDKQKGKNLESVHHLNLIGYMLGKMILNSDGLTEFMLQNMLDQLSTDSGEVS